MIIKGELQPHGQVGSLHLYMQVSLSTLVGMIWIRIVYVTIVGLVGAATFQGFGLGVLQVSWIGLEIPWLVIIFLGMWLAMAYIGIVIGIHRQTRLLFKQLISYADEFGHVHKIRQ